MAVSLPTPSPFLSAMEKFSAIDKYLPREAQEALKPIEQHIPKSIEHFFSTESVTYTKERADIDLSILDILDKNPTINRGDLLNQFNLTQPEIFNNQADKEFLDKHISLFLERRNTVKNAIESCETPEQLFKKLFGKEPVGEIQLAGGALSVDFVCFNKEDFDYVYKADYSKSPRPLIKDDVGGCIVRDCLDEKLKGAVIVAKSHDLIPSSEGNNFIGVSEIESTESTILHEDTHTRLRLLADKKDIDYIDNLDDFDVFTKKIANLPEKEFEQELTDFVVQMREFTYEYSIKDELSAFLFSGMETSDIALKLRYQYQDQERVSTITEKALVKGLTENTKETHKAVFAEIAVYEVFQDFYVALHKAIEKTTELLNSGYTKKEISMILQNIHFRQFISDEKIL